MFVAGVLVTICHCCHGLLVKFVVNLTLNVRFVLAGFGCRNVTSQGSGIKPLKLATAQAKRKDIGAGFMVRNLSELCVQLSVEESAPCIPRKAGRQRLGVLCSSCKSLAASPLPEHQ